MVALRQIFRFGSFFDTEPKLLDAYHQMINVVQIHVLDREWHKARCRWERSAYDEYVARMQATLQVETYWHEDIAVVLKAFK